MMTSQPLAPSAITALIIEFAANLTGIYERSLNFKASA